MRGISVEKMTMEDLREVILVLSKRGGGMPPPNLKKWPKKRCLEWLNDGRNAVPDTNVGDYMRGLLRIVIGRTLDDYPVGLSYQEIMRLVKTRFPDSAVKKTHPQWYANQMRAAGETIPVYRERSNWKGTKDDEEENYQYRHGGIRTGRKPD